MNKENNYSKTALNCVENYQENTCIKKLWKVHVKLKFPLSKSSQNKGCPKNTFLGLCEEGLVKGIPKGNYTKSIKNKQYALEAIDILRNNKGKTFSPLELWNKVKKELFINKKDHNSQMNVVLALWEHHFIEKRF